MCYRIVAKKSDENEPWIATVSTSGKATSSKSANNTADSVDALCRAAQTEDSSYVSFSSFLAIKSSEEAQTKSGSQRSEATKTDEAVWEQTVPLGRAKVTESQARQVPVKEKEAKKTFRKKLKASIDSLLGDQRML